MQRSERKRARLAGLCSVSAVTALAIFAINARAEQPPAPCHPNPTADADETAVRSRGDVVNLPAPLQDRLAQLANRPHTYLPLQVFNEADGASQLFQYYLLDTTGFEPNVFTAIIPGVNDGNVQLTATGGNCGLPTVGAVRVVLEPKPGLPTDPTNPRAFNDVFTDISPLFVINNESGWYEGWMIHDITVPAVAAASLRWARAIRNNYRARCRDPATNGHRQQCCGKHLHRRRPGSSLPERLRPLSPTNKQTSSRSMRAWGLTMPSSNRTSTPIGSSTI